MEDCFGRAKYKLNQLIKMSQGNSIFSSPNGSNGEAPANPFASLAAGPQKPAAASPFAAVTPTEPESPFGFAAEEPASERPQAKLPEKRSQAPAAPVEGNPFQSASAAPQAEVAPTPSAPAPAASPFTAEGSFEAPAAPAPAPQGFEALGNPLSTPAPEPVAATPDPARAPEPAPVRLEQPVASHAAPVAAAAPSPAPSGGMGAQSTRQLELRAIFGSEGEMNRDEILTRAKGLPGIREVTVVGAGESSAVQTIDEVMARFGFGGTGSWQMTCSGGVVDFISSENTTLAVLREGRYSGGVWETLMIVARELGKLS